jgi:hypothetical protein
VSYARHTTISVVTPGSGLIPAAYIALGLSRASLHRRQALPEMMTPALGCAATAAANRGRLGNRVF